jgi:hypothetical protein
MNSTGYVEPRNGHIAISWNNGSSMLVYGGEIYDLESNIAILDLNSFNWTQYVPPGALVRYLPSSVVYEEKLYLFGGEIFGSPSNSMAIFNSQGSIWQDDVPTFGTKPSARAAIVA